MYESMRSRNTIERAIASLATAALLALGSFGSLGSLGCGDDGVTQAKVTEDNVLALGLAAAETTYRGAVTTNLLIQLGYILPASVIVGPPPAMAASPDIMLEPPDALCSTGTSNVNVDDSQSPPFITTTYTQCVLQTLPCVVDGVVTADLSGPGVTLQADGVDVSCMGIGIWSLTDESASCGGGECDVALNPFDSEFEDTQVKPRSLLLSGTLFPNIEEFDSEGTAILSGEGEFDFETDLGGSVMLGCPAGLPVEAVIVLFGAGDSWGTIAFDDVTCSTLQVCWQYGDMDRPECDEVPFPGLPQ